MVSLAIVYVMIEPKTSLTRALETDKIMKLLRTTPTRDGTPKISAIFRLFWLMALYFAYFAAVAIKVGIDTSLLAGPATLICIPNR